MGLCKCERRKVTNLFCFEHRVNVCDHCAVADHKRCIIKSYLHWLQDSDYSPTCELCKESLLDESTGECVRLLCYDVFHWKCLDKWAASMPTNTAPAGFTCPVCNSGIFPVSNDVSPVAVALRQLLSAVSWSRAGLGLPILLHDSLHESAPQMLKESADETNRKPSLSEVPSSPKPRPPAPSPTTVMSNDSNSIPSSPTGHHLTFNAPSHSSPLEKNLSQSSSPNADGSPDSGRYGYSDGLRSTGFGNNFDTDSQGSVYVRKPFASDSDESSNKYKRRSPMLMLARWLSFGASTALTPHELTLRRRRRFYMMVLLAGVALFTLIYLGISIGRSHADLDPLLDPRANPHLRFKPDSVGEAVASN